MRSDVMGMFNWGWGSYFKPQGCVLDTDSVVDFKCHLLWSSETIFDMESSNIKYEKYLKVTSTLIFEAQRTCQVAGRPNQDGGHSWAPHVFFTHSPPLPTLHQTISLTTGGVQPSQDKDVFPKIVSSQETSQAGRLYFSLQILGIIFSDSW